MLKERNSDIKVGIAKEFNPIENYHWWNSLEWSAVKLFDYLLHDTFLNYFKTGYFNWAYMERGKNEKAPALLDFIGLNYYSHTLIKQSNR